MSLSQILVLIAAVFIVIVGSTRDFKKRIKEFLRRTNYKLSCYLGYSPTSNELKNENIKKLATQLEGESDKETLTNVLEWQQRNIGFWSERWPISTIFLVSSIMLVASVLIAAIYVFLSVLTVLPILFWLIILFGTITATTFSIIFLVLLLNRKIPLKEVPRGLKNVFASSISMSFLIKYRLGICRDYAKLTACLLSKLYPDSEIYFFHAFQHVAAGVRIKNDRFYVIDQSLPIYTAEKWDKRWRLNGIEKLAKNSLEGVKKEDVLKAINKSRLDIKKLAVKMEKLLNVGGNQTGTKTVPMTLGKGAIRYEDDEIVNYSLARLIKLKASSELVNIDKITGIEIERHKDDLKILIHFN